ncbi:hypothetical protein BO82DRAFT_437383 [Aspergillus uvarum CBS 121591]|uniref:Uncharacterized protein n=1 Tax=Aspergillus uvarum CBS 121591 TaxID=1448315 RepID=A0A319BV87_9EURO|nr:hypothetical protein BO82DRAFT_437383 [Aspergillus uvarum CBS 121591]PYH75459.1 hypothetical protein BO82DRAFT_437383 [Aspergillus uvarum CBS 121591]
MPLHPPTIFGYPPCPSIASVAVDISMQCNSGRSCVWVVLHGPIACSRALALDPCEPDW